MVDKELIERYRKTVKPVVASWLLNINHEGLGEQDKEEFERDFDEILDLALIGLKYKAQLSREGTTKDATSDTISRQAAIDAIMDEVEPFAIVEPGTTCVIGTGVNNNDVVRVLEQLPSAQPEQRYTEEELKVFQNGISLSLLSKRSSQHWFYDEDTATEIEFLERLYEKVSADMRGETE